MSPRKFLVVMLFSGLPLFLLSGVVFAQGPDPVADALATFFGVPNDAINNLRDDHWGYGEITFAYWRSWLSGEDVNNIIEMRDDMGWGQIFQEFLSSGPAGFNLGAVMSGRMEDLAEECGLPLEELQGLIQDTGASLPDLSNACRLAAETDGEVSFEDILEMHEGGTSWGEIRQGLGLAGNSIESSSQHGHSGEHGNPHK